MTRILTLSNAGVPDGYGRIHDEIMPRLSKRGYQIMAASLVYDGLLPAQYEGRPLPYHVASLAGHADWPQQFVALVRAYQPDMVLVIQDAPYGMTVQDAAIDWSKHALMVITPVDGVPVYKPWVDMLKRADGTMSISQFGVDAHKAAGVASALCRPGIDPDTFYRLPDDQRLSIRKKLGIDPDAFVMGVCAQNQGRKDIPHMMEAFFKFASDKPDARLLLNMEAVSPAGWDLPALCTMNGWDAGKIIWRTDCDRLGVTELRERYNVMDAHAVIAHREGWGLPLIEAQACGVVSMALDYCSGTEICGANRGVLVKCADYAGYSTWGGAMDRFPDMQHFVQQLQKLHDEPELRKSIANNGMAQARTWTWTQAVDNTAAMIEQIMAKRAKIPAAGSPLFVPVVTPASVDGMQAVEA